MAYNSIVTQSGSTGIPPAAPSAAPLIPMEYANEIISLVPDTSVALRLFHKYNMGTSTAQMPVLDALPEAFWVNNHGTAAPGTPGSSGTYSALQQTNSMGWKGVQLVAEQLSVILPVPNTLLADSSFDLWAEMTPKVAAALARKLDSAVFFGADSPFVAPGLVPHALSAGNVYTLGTASQATGGLANDINQGFNLVEAGSGFDVNGFVANKNLKVRLRNARDTTGQQLGDISPTQANDVDINYAMGGKWPMGGSFTGSTTSGSNQVTLSSGSATAANIGDAITGAGVPAGTVIASVTDSTHIVLDANATATASGVALTLVAPTALLGDFTQAILGERQDLEFAIRTEGSITDDQGRTVLNLMQQGAQALQVTARYAFAVANSVTYFNQNDSTRSPFAVLLG